MHGTSAGSKYETNQTHTIRHPMGSYLCCIHGGLLDEGKGVDMMDASTIDHLGKWCNQQFPNDTKVYPRMVRYLNCMDAEDLAYTLTHRTWWDVYDMLPPMLECPYSEDQAVCFGDGTPKGQCALCGAAWFEHKYQ